MDGKKCGYVQECSYYSVMRLDFSQQFKGAIAGFYITVLNKQKKVHAAVPDVCALLCFLRFTGRINVVICCKLYKCKSFQTLY